MTDPEMKEVDKLLGEVANRHPAVSDHLMMAVLQDAATVQPRSAVARRSLWEMCFEAIGGWPSMGGLAAAGLAGVWVGFAPPVALEAATAQLLGAAETVDLLGSFELDGFVGEGAVQ